MASPARLMSTTELYPPEWPVEYHNLVRWILTNDADAGGRRIIRRALTAPESLALLDRFEALKPYLTHGMYNEIARHIAELLTRYGSKGATLEESAVTVQAYARALGDLPLWCIKRACDRFAQGRVTPEEIGSKTKIDPNYTPSSGAIHMVARAFWLPVAEEYARIGAITAGLPRRPEQTPEERAASAAIVRGIAADVRRAFAQKHLDEIEKENAAQADRQERARLRSIEDRRRTYLAHNIDPPEGEDFASVPMMLQMGYTIQEIGGGKSALVRPKPEAKRPEPR